MNIQVRVKTSKSRAKSWICNMDTPMRKAKLEMQWSGSTYMHTDPSIQNRLLPPGAYSPQLAVSIKRSPSWRRVHFSWSHGTRIVYGGIFLAFWTRQIHPDCDDPIEIWNKPHEIQNYCISKDGISTEKTPERFLTVLIGKEVHSIIQIKYIWPSFEDLISFPT